jgi:hypothetical protein
LTSIIDHACRELDRKAGVDRSADAIRVALATIAGSSIPSSQRLALICELEMAWQQAGLV